MGDSPADSEKEIVDIILRGTGEKLQEYLTKNGVKPVLTKVMGPQKRSLLHFAASVGNVGCLRVLLQKPGELVNLQDQALDTPLHLAVACGEVEAVKLLLASGANVNIENGLKRKPLDYAKDLNIQTLLKNVSLSAPPMALSVTERSRTLARDFRREDLVKIESELPDNARGLRLFVMDVLISYVTFMDRCKDSIKNLIQEKNIAHHKVKLVNHTAGLSGKEGMVDQLQYLVDENDKINGQYAKAKMNLDQAQLNLQKQWQWWNDYCEYLQKVYVQERQYLYTELETARRELMEHQGKTQVDLSEIDKLRTEVSVLKNSKTGKVDLNPASEKMITTLQTEVGDLRKKLATMEYEKKNLGTKVGLLDLSAQTVGSEIEKLREENRLLRLNSEDEKLKKLRNQFDRQDDEDAKNNLVIFVPGESNSKQIKAITPDKLLERIVDRSILNEESLNRSFLMTCKSYMTVDSVLTRLTKKFEEKAKEGEEHVHQQILFRLTNLLKLWIDEFWEDLSEKPLLDQLNTFVKSLTDTKYTNILKPAMEKKITPPVDERPANVTVPKPIIPKSLTKRYEAGPTGAKLAEKTHDVNNRGGLFAKKSADVSDLKFIDLDPTEIARQLTLVEFEMFSSLSPREFVDLAWMKEDKKKRAPNICRMTEWSNHVIQWLISEIVSVKDSVKSRSATYERIVAIAKCLETLNNYNGIKECLAALDSSSIFRLKKTREAISDKSLKDFESLHQLTSNELNFKLLRAKVRESVPPMIPFPGVVQSDLVFLDSCGKNRLDNGMVNFQKYVKVTNYVTELLQFQRTKYYLEPIIEIQDYIRSFEVLDDDAAYTSSLVCEPRGS